MGNAFSQLGYILFFSAARKNIYLHQSTLVLFIRVWEEVSTILIDYLINSPLSPFLKMLELFDFKEYQAGVGNISHIHLLGKLCQLSEHLRT